MNFKKVFPLVCASALVVAMLILARHNLNRGDQVKPAATPDRYIKSLDFLPSPDGKSIAVRRRIEQPKKGNVTYELWLLSLGRERAPGLTKSRLIYSADTKNDLASRFLSWNAKSETVLFYTWDRKTRVRSERKTHRLI